MLASYYRERASRSRSGIYLMMACLTAVYSFSLTACSSGPTLSPEQLALKNPETRDSVLSQIQIGTPRAKVEKLLGRPSSETITAQGAQVNYTFGMDEMMEGMQPSRASSIGSSILGTLGSVAGFAGPAGGMAAGVGTGLLDAATTSSTPDPMDAMQKIETFAITYRNNQVALISKNRGGMGAMMQGLMGGAGGMGAPGMAGVPLESIMGGRGMMEMPTDGRDSFDDEPQGLPPARIPAH